MDHDNYVRIGTDPATMELVFFKTSEPEGVPDRVQEKVRQIGGAPRVVMWKPAKGLSYAVIGTTKGSPAWR